MRVVRFIVGWLSLAVTGLLAYALLRALAAIVYLGAPAFDWQWYVPVIILVLVVSVKLTCRWWHLQAKRLGRRTYYPSDWRGYYVYLHEMGMARLYPASQRSHLIGLVGAGFPGEPLLELRRFGARCAPEPGDGRT
jgi:hypothetical protein